MTMNYQTKYLKDNILQKKNTTLFTAFTYWFFITQFGFAQYTIPKAPTLQTRLHYAKF
jgi:uncharacterized protein